jgi:hypothetical protein
MEMKSFARPGAASFESIISDNDSVQESIDKLGLSLDRVELISERTRLTTFMTDAS